MHHEPPLDYVLLTLLALAAAVYVGLAVRQRRGPRGWSAWRIAAHVSGILLAAVALLPRLVPFPSGDFREHMLQHLLIAMLAPLGLALSAPVTLVLRSVPKRYGRVIGRWLRSRYMRIVSNPVVALILNVGGMAVLYFTPLYAATMRNTVLHHFVHWHFLLAGYLFVWVIAGPDPGLHRPSVPARLVVMGVAIAVHASLAQLMYAGLYVAVPAPAQQLQGAAELMYYGGDIADLLLAFALVSTWRPRRAHASAPASAPALGEPL
jgi:putative membrane protein